MPVILGGNTGIYLASLAPSVDPDAQAFITAASITDPTQQSAINQLVVDLKGYNIWSKMKALYPFVGGTAAQHKWNLKDPRDLDAAFRLVFSGGWTHSNTGATPNGTNGYADTKLNPSVSLGQNSASYSVYSRTNTDVLGTALATTAGTGFSGENSIFIKFGSQTYIRVNTSTPNTPSNTDGRGYFIANRNLSTQQNLMTRGTRADFSNNSQAPHSANFLLGGFAPYYDNKEYAFAHIGDGLTNTDLTNLNTSVQAFQTTLGRSIGTQTVSDADAQAFVTNAGIVDQVEANAINNLVIGLKADSLWTKMKAVYPFVGGTSTTNSYNLKNTAQYQITWYGGVTHSSNGITGNGTNGYGDTFLANNIMAQNDAHISVYSRTNWQQVSVDIGSWNGSFGSFIYSRSAANTFETTINSTNRIIQANLDSRGFYLVTRKSGTSQTGQKNTTQYVTATASTNHITTSFKLLRPGEYNGEYSPRNLAFASIGDGLTDAEALNLNTRVTTFQTALNRNI